MNEEQKIYIRDQLKKIELDHNVSILLAIESGSRAWGFPSKDSDYDVRFIYAHKQDHYLSIDEQRDVIETPIHHDRYLNSEFDMNGWDIKKAIKLALRGNSVVNEWLTSPISYIEDADAVNDLRQFVSTAADLRSYFYFYRNYMRTPWESYSNNEETQIKIKHYCYCLRCALALEWLDKQKSPPPMDVPSLLEGIDLDDKLLSEIEKLIAQKKQSIESDRISRISHLDDFIDRAISEERDRPTKDALQARHTAEANALFRKIISQI